MVVHVNRPAALLFTIAISTLSYGCMTSSMTVKGSSATGVLLRDTSNTIMGYEKLRFPHCHEKRTVTVDPLAADRPSAIMERWIVVKCGLTNSYRVTYIPTPAIGGTDMIVTTEN